MSGFANVNFTEDGGVALSGIPDNFAGGVTAGLALVTRILMSAGITDDTGCAILKAYGAMGKDLIEQTNAKRALRDAKQEGVA